MIGGVGGSLAWLVCDGDMRWDCGILSSFSSFSFFVQLSAAVSELGFNLGIYVAFTDEIAALPACNLGCYPKGACEVGTAGVVRAKEEVEFS